MGLLRSPGKTMKNAFQDLMETPNRRSLRASSRNNSTSSSNVRGSLSSTMSIPMDFKESSSAHTRSTSTTTTNSNSTDSPLTVRFDEDSNEFYAPPEPEQRGLVRDLWYSGADNAGFRRECSQLARLLSAADAAGDSDAASSPSSSSSSSGWSTNLLQAYQGFCQAETAEQVMQVFEQYAAAGPASAKDENDPDGEDEVEADEQGEASRDNEDDEPKSVLLPDNATGLDSWIVRPIHYERVERRRKLMQQVVVKYSRGCKGLDAETRERKCGKASRTLSRPSRLYAHHLGLLVAQAVLQEQEQGLAL